MSRARNVKIVSLFFDAQCYLYQGLWGVTRLHFLLSFLLRVAVREQACKMTLQSLSQGNRCCTSTARSMVAALFYRLWSQHLVQNSHCYCNRNPIKKVVSHSATSCLSQQHLIRTLLSEVLHSTWYDRVSARKCLPLTNEQLSQATRVRKIMKRKQLTILN